MKIELGDGVRYRDADYIGFWKRLVILVMDIIVVAFILLPGALFDHWNSDPLDFYDEHYGVYVSLFFAYLYLTVIKASKIGTLGQIVTKSEIVTIRGKRPGIMKMTYRLFFWVLGPVNFMSDIVFLTMIKEKRTIRDCLCNTLVIRRGAKPEEENLPIHVARVYALGLNLMYESCYSVST